MNSRFIINFQPGETLLHKLTGTTKVRTFLILTLYLIMSFDLRLIIPLLIVAVIGLFSLKIKWKPFKYILTIFFIYNMFSLFLYYMVNQDIGTDYSHTETILWTINSHYYISGETLWYLLTRLIKIFTTILISFVFINSITPSEFAAGLYSVKIPYKICTVVALAFRCIPDIYRDYNNIHISMQARGVELDPKTTKLTVRIKQSIMIIIPLLFSSFDKVGNIANAMDLRGYGKKKHRSWYAEHAYTRADHVFRIIYSILLLFCVGYIVYRITAPGYTYLWYPFA